MTQQVADQIDAASEGELRWAIAFARKPCPDPGYHHVHGSSLEGEHCMDCDGSGTVYALEGVRRPCRNKPFADKHPMLKCNSKCWSECGFCYGIGEVPVEDGWVWLEAARRYLSVRDWSALGQEMNRTQTFRRSILCALAQVLETQGANLALEEA